MAVSFSEAGVLASLALNIGIAIVGATWGIARIRDAVRDAMEEHKRDYDGKLDLLTRQFSDTFAALRQKISDVELEAARVYLRRESFYQIRQEISSEIRDFRDDLKDRLDRLETKIDSKT